jgi:hypothetical protein
MLEEGPKLVIQRLGSGGVKEGKHHVHGEKYSSTMWVDKNKGKV